MPSEPITADELDELSKRHRATAALAGPMNENVEHLVRQLLVDTAQDYEDAAFTIRTLTERVADLEKRAADEGATVMVFEHHGEAMLVDPVTGKRMGWYRDAETALEVHRFHEAAPEGET